MLRHFEEQSFLKKKKIPSKTPVCIQKKNHLTDLALIQQFDQINTVSHNNIYSIINMFWVYFWIHQNGILVGS